MLNLGRVRALCEVGDRGTIAAAAAALHLTPSAVSQQISALERELGEKLVEPDGRRIRLTSVGRVLVRRADAVFAEVESLRAEVAEHSRGLRGELRIGAFPTAIAHIVAPAARALRAAAPGVRLEVVEAEGEDAFARLTRQELDIVVSIEAPGAPPRDDPRTVRTALGADRMRAVLSEEHPLARCSEVALEELAGEDWVVPPVGWLCERVILAGCQTAGFTPRVVHRAGDWSAIVALCGAGMGVGMVPQLAGALDIPGAVVLAVAEPAPRRHIFAACRRGAEDAPAVRAVLDAMGAVALTAPDNNLAAAT